MHFKKKLSILLVTLICALLLVGCSEKVELSTGKYEVEETTSIQAIVTAEDLALMDGLTMLQTADFSGSSCVAEIFHWAQAHPNVKVTYTMTLPTGKTVDNRVSELDLSGVDAAALTAFAPQLKYLPDVKSITLADAGVLGSETLDVLSAACPNAQISYHIALRGEELSPDTASFDFSGITSEELSGVLPLLSMFDKVEQINLNGSSLTWDDFALIKEACPEAVLDYSFELYGKPVTLADSEMDFSYMQLSDNGEALRQALPYFTNCTFVNMDSCGISNEDMAALQAEFPDTKIVWRVFFGTKYSLRTDAEKCLASKPSIGGNFYGNDLDVLKYCTDLKYIDIGHSEELTSLDFAATLTKLEVLVAAMNNVTDISALANCPNLEYLELNSSDVIDLTPLSGLTKLRHLNVANCPNVTDITPLYSLTELERLWIGCITPVPAEQVEEMQKAAPNCQINTEAFDPTTGGWRVTGYTELSLKLFAETGWLQEVLHPRYELLKQQFGYTDQDFSFYFNDPTYLGPAY